ncbi:MAG: LysR family transcriptional regulator [Pseudomonadota bacterium]
MLIDNLRVFQAIAEKGSLAAAAREMRLSATTVSDRLAALEAHYGVTLVNRTTRSLHLTDEGQTLLAGSRGLLAEVEALDARIRHGARTLSGPIRIGAPIDLGRGLLSEVVEAFIAAHPNVTIEMALSDGFVDIVGLGLDLALRFGTVADSTLRLRALGEIQRRVCAAPAYLDRHGVPETPDALSAHTCLVMRFGSGLDDVWHFHVDGKPKRVAVRGNRVVNDGSLVRRWALAGHGIILKSELDVAEDIEAGRLVSLLEDYLPPPVPLQILYPPGSLRPRRVSAFSDALAALVKGRRGSDHTRTEPFL